MVSPPMQTLLSGQVLRTYLHFLRQVPLLLIFFSGGRRNLHYVYPNGVELVEEYDVNSNELLRKNFLENFSFFSVRKWKKPKDFGEATWEYEVGKPEKKFDAETDVIGESSQNVISFFTFLACFLEERLGREI